MHSKLPYTACKEVKYGHHRCPDCTDRYLTCWSHRSCSIELQQSSSLRTSKSLHTGLAPRQKLPCWFIYFVSSADSVWRTTRVGSWTNPVLVVHCWLATAYWRPQSLPSSVCRWLSSLWDLSSVCNAGASEQHLYLHQWCGHVDVLQPAPAEYCKDRGSLVYI